LFCLCSEIDLSFCLLLETVFCSGDLMGR
jgi:hypothetical protein